MNFEALKGLIESIINSYSCDSCKHKLSSSDISIKDIKDQTVFLELHCPKCNTKSNIKSEIRSIDINSLNLPEEQLSQIKDTIQKLSLKGRQVNNKTAIKDEQIVELHKDLRKDNFSVGDLF